MNLVRRGLASSSLQGYCWTVSSRAIDDQEDEWTLDYCTCTLLSGGRWQSSPDSQTLSQTEGFGYARLSSKEIILLSTRTLAWWKYFDSGVCMLDSCRQELFHVRSTAYTGEECARGTAVRRCVHVFVDSVMLTEPPAGVFAAHEIPQGAVVEVAHCIKLSAQEYQNHGRCGQIRHMHDASKVTHVILLTGCSMP